MASQGIRQKIQFTGDSAPFSAKDDAELGDTGVRVLFVSLYNPNIYRTQVMEAMHIPMH
jgi:hypothetical protein